MRLCFFIFFYLALSLCLPQSGQTTSDAKSRENEAIELFSKVDKAEINIGDRFHYFITVSYPSGGRIELPSVLGNLGQFEVKDYQPGSPQKKDSRTEQTFSFELSTFTIGDYLIAPQIVNYYSPHDSLPKIQSYTEPIQIHVRRSSPEDTKDIADIAELASIPNKFPWIWIVLTGVILLAGFLIWLLLSRKKKEEVKALASPHDEVLEALQKLANNGEMLQNDHRSFCFALSEILRRYITRRFGVDALESTTEEFLLKIPSLGLEQDKNLWLLHFCQETDTVKFAAGHLEVGRTNSLIEEMKYFVLQTKEIKITSDATKSNISSENSGPVINDSPTETRKGSA